jgi:hypothetical protein
VTDVRWWIHSWWAGIDVRTERRISVVEVGEFVVPLHFEAIAVGDDYDALEEWPVLAMQLEMFGARPVIHDLAVTYDKERAFREQGLVEPRDQERTDGDLRPRHINGSLLRELPLTRLAKYAMLGVAYRLDAEAPVGERVVPHELRDGGFYRIGPDQVPEYGESGSLSIQDPAWQSASNRSEQALWSAQMEALADAAERATTARRRRRVTNDLLARVSGIYREAMKVGNSPKKAVRDAEHVSESTAGRYIMEARKRGLLGPTLPGKKGEIAG